MNRKDKIVDIENTEGASDINRIIALRSYENERMHPTNVREREDKDNSFKNIQTAYNEGNYEGAKSLYEVNKDILDDEYIASKTEEGSKLKKFLTETGKMVGTAVESTLNNVYEVADDTARWMEKFGVPNIYVGVQDGEFKVYTQRPENATVRPFEFVDNPESLIGNLGSGFIEFMIPFKTMLTATKAYKGGNLATNALKVYGSGAVADFMFSPENGNLASLLVELGVQNEFVNWLDSRPENADDLEQKLKARGKATLEGGIFGIAFDTLIHAVRYMKQSPEWVAKAKSYLSSNFEDAGAALPVSGGATTNLSEVIPAADNVLSEAKSARTTSANDISPVGTKEEPSQTTTLPGPEEIPTTSPSKDLGNVNNLSAINIENKIYQVDNDINTLLVKAKNNKPKLDELLNKYNSKYETNIKEVGSITTKLKTKERNPNGLPDYLRGRIYPEYKNIDDVAAQVEKDLKILDKDYNTTTRSFHYQIEIEPGFSAELQIMPNEIASVINKHHITWYSKIKQYGKNSIPINLQIQYYEAHTKLMKDLDTILLGQ